MGSESEGILKNFPSFLGGIGGLITPLKFPQKPVMPKGEGIAQKLPPEILDELIPPPPWTEAKKFYLEEKFHFFLLKCLFGFRL